MRRYYEFAVVVVVISVLALVLMNALGRAQADMEEAMVQAEAAAIRSQLLEVLAHREGFGGTLPKSDNPLDWVATVPQNYRGALDGVPEEKRIWYFDTGSGELVYRFQDGHSARFRLSREAGRTESRGVLAGVGLLRLSDKFE
jgi:type II secretory pathway pseudopilin PulG